jgi:hypothetical protein
MKETHNLQTFGDKGGQNIIFNYIFNTLIQILKMDLNKPKHVATFSKIVYIIKLC